MLYASSKTRTVFSQELDIEVKPLPEGVELVGELDIEVNVDKKEINAGEAVNVTIEVKGAANIEDIPVFDIHVDGAQAFEEEPKIKHFLEDGKYYGSFIQKSALVAERDFTLPAFELRYMDVRTDSVKTIRSKAIDIKVLNPAPLIKEELKISRPAEEVKNADRRSGVLTLLQGTLLLLGGFVLGLIASMIPYRRLLGQEKSKHPVPPKESKEVLRLLMSNMDGDQEIESLVEKLSENLYEGKDHEIDKKSLKKILKKLQE